MDSKVSPRVAVLMAIYNGAQFLEEQLLSVLGQSHRNLEIFVRDDGSTDHSLKLVDRYRAETGRVHVLPVSERYGAPAPSFLALLKYAVGFEDYEFFAFCDQDDVWAPAKVAEALSCLQRESADGYSGNLIAYGFTPLTAYVINKPSKLATFDYLFQSASAGCTYVLSRRAARLIVQQLGDIDYRLLATRSHDWLTYAICRSHGLNWVHDPRALIFYRQHGRNSYGGNSGMQGVRKRWALFRSGWYHETVCFNCQFMALNSAEQEVYSRFSRWSLGDRLWLTRRVFNFRRKKRECLVLAAYFLAGVGGAPGNALRSHA